MRARFLDDAAPGRRWDPVAVGRNARAAAQDSATAAYIGELDSEPTRASMPIVNDAGIAQISPGASAIDLTAPAEGYPDSPQIYRPSGEASFARVVPSDAVQVRALAEWLGRLNVPRASVSEVPGPFGELMASEFAGAAAEVGIEVVQGPPITGQLREVAATYSRFLAGLGALGPGRLLTDDLSITVSGAVEARRLPAGRFRADFRSSFGRSPGPYAAYGYEAMRVALDAIARADTQGGFRASVVDGVLDSEHPGSVLGDFSITSDGDTTLCAVQRYRYDGGRIPLAAVCPD